MPPFSTQDYQLIEAYLLEKLDAIERSKVEARCAQDEPFRMEVLRYRTLIEAATEEDVIAFDQMLGQIETSMIHRAGWLEPIKQWVKQYPYAFGGGVILLALLAVFVMLIPSPSSPTDLFSTYYQAPALAISDNHTVVPWEKAYQTGDYGLALVGLQGHLASQNTSDEKWSRWQFYAAICELSLDRPEQAVGFLVKVLQTPTSSFLEDAQWYLAMSQLKRGETEVAEAIFARIAREGEKWKDKAGEVVGIINK